MTEITITIKSIDKPYYLLVCTSYIISWSVYAWFILQYLLLANGVGGTGVFTFHISVVVATDWN